MKKIFFIHFFLLSFFCFKLNQGPLKDDPTGFYLESLHLDLLGPQDEFTKAFASINNNLKFIDKLTFNTTSFSYTIFFGQKPTLSYNRTYQQTYIVQQNDAMVVQGGQLNATFYCIWRKVSLQTPLAEPLQGYIFASTLSDSNSFWKIIRLENKSQYNSYMVQVKNVTWNGGISEPFNIRFDIPKIVADEDKEIITKMFNSSLPGIKNVREHIQEAVNVPLPRQLIKEVQKFHFPHFQPKFNYTWIPGAGKPNMTIPFVRKPEYFWIRNNGVVNYYGVTIEGFENYRNSQIKKPADIDYHIFTCVTFSFISLIVNYALEKKLFDTELTQERWSSSTFKFLAGDLYDVIPLLKKNHLPRTLLEGYCNVSMKEPYFSGEPDNAPWMESSFNSMCHLNIKDENIISFLIVQKFKIYVTGTRTEADFSKVDYLPFSVYFYPHGQYQVSDENLAKKIVGKSLERLKQTTMFGHGFPIGPFKKQVKSYTNGHYEIDFYEDPYSEKILI